MEQQILNSDKDSYMPIFIGFSAKSRCSQVQDLIDAKLDRRRKGVFGPAMNRKAIIMIDDLNMPIKEVYGMIFFFRFRIGGVRTSYVGGQVNVR